LIEADGFASIPPLQLKKRSMASSSPRLQLSNLSLDKVASVGEAKLAKGGIRAKFLHSIFCQRHTPKSNLTLLDASGKLFAGKWIVSFAEDVPTHTFKPRVEEGLPHFPARRSEWI